MKKETIYNLIVAATIIFVILFMLLMIQQFIGMMIDNQCYQLIPGSNYKHTICEKYWK